MTLYLWTIAVLLFPGTRSQSQAPLNFSRSIVWFDPFASVEDIYYLQKYGEPKLLPLIQHAATIFSRLLVPIYNPESWTEKRNFSSLELIPGVVAQVNREAVKNKLFRKPIEVWLVYMIPSENWEDVEGRSIQRLKGISDNANSIYPSTVRAIMEYYNFAGLPPQSLTTPERTSLLKENSYNYGLILRLETWISSGDELTAFLREASKNLDILMFAHSPSNKEVEEGQVTESIANATKIFEECQQSCLKDFLTSPTRTQLIPVGFVTEWPDTGENGTISYSNLVSYWGNMSTWAEASSTPLVLRNAFDTHYEDEVTKKTRGWWRLIEGGDQIGSDDGGRPPRQDAMLSRSPKLQFLEKVGLPSESEELAKLSKNLTWLNEDTQFSRDHIILRFDPFISNGPEDKWASGPNDDTHLAHLFQQASTKISKVILHELKLFEKDPRIGLIPGVVAKIRRFNGDPKGGAPFEVIPTVRKMVDWDMTKDVADEANFQSPGTVQTIMLQINEERFPPERLVELKTFFQRARNNSRIVGTGGSYKLGGMFFSDKCFIPETTPEFMDETAPIIPFFDQLFFMELIDTEEFMKLGVDRVVSQLTTRFQNCRHRIRRAAGGWPVEVGLLTGWSDTPDEWGKQSYAGQVKYWEMMNDWAVETNTKIIFLEVFDQARKKEGGHLGWWRLVQNDSYKSVSEFVFQDKKALALEAYLGKPVSYKATLKPIEIAAIVIVTILIIALITLSALLIHRRKRDAGRRLHLTHEEIREFFNGIKEEIKLALQQEGVNPQDNQQCNRPYDKEQYELMNGSFVVDETSVLGTGEFGKVCRGKVRLQRIQEKGETTQVSRLEETHVAVKMTNTSCSDPKAALQGLLSEIKILSFLGTHDNIVSLIGAYTANLNKDNTVYLFLELCEGGSLEKYLRKWDIGKVRRVLQGGGGGYGNMSMDEIDSRGYVKQSSVRGVELSVYENIMEEINLEPESQEYINMHRRTAGLVDISTDLNRWAKEIVNGMEFLASKNVLHADLATRNVLLTGQKKTAKISDFGLSRRLYDYTNYVKSKQEPLPWRWMAPESLKRLEFNEKSDVWAYGVTLWEIFTCGEIPFPGLSWDVDFCCQLENGLRMKKPIYCDQGMYEVMLKCWQFEPEDRPTFSDLKDFMWLTKS